MSRVFILGFRWMMGGPFVVIAFFFLFKENQPAAGIASLLLGVALLLPPQIKVRARINPFWTNIPFKQTITAPVLLSASRWWMGFVYTAAGIGGFAQKEDYPSLAMFLMGIIFISPLDRFFFPTLQFQEKRDKSIYILIMRNTGVFLHFLALGIYIEQKPVAANILLAAAFGLLLAAAFMTDDILLAPQPNVEPFSMKHFKMPSFKLPPLKIDQPKQPIARSTTNNKPGRPVTTVKTETDKVKKTRKKRYPDAYTVQWKIKPSTTEEEFNQWIKEYQANWLEAKEYRQRLMMHRNPDEFKNQIIGELNSYIQEIRERPALNIIDKNSKGKVTVTCVADDVITVWKSNRQLRSLFRAAKAYSSQSGSKSFWKYAAHLAEYRAMINLVKMIKRTQPRIVKPIAAKVTLNKQVETTLGTHIAQTVIASLLHSAPAIAKETLPAFNDETYFKIIDYIILLGKNLESFKDLNDKMSEERYRDYFLPFLNAVSPQYSAKGEVFNRKGKTDILVFDDHGNNLFIAECKLWKGEGYLLAGIDQLFNNYVNWRDEKTAIIIFNRDIKKFSDLIITATNALTNHPLYAGGGEQRSDASWSFRFHHPHDAQRIIKLELILFNFA